MVPNANVDTVSVLLGRGDGTFGASADYAAGDYPRTVAAADLDGDGHADLAVVNRSSDDVSVLLGRGDASFGRAASYDAGDKAYDVAAADFNADGKLDLAVPNTIADNVSVLLGRGDGTFGRAVNYGVGDGPFAVAIADFDGDARADLAVGNHHGAHVSVLPGRGNGTLDAPATYGVGTSVFDIKAADFDGDAKPDLAVAHNPSTEGFNGYSGDAAILLNDGNGGFGKPVHYGVGNGPVAVTTADLNGDARADLAATNIESDDVSVLLQGGTGLSLSASRTLATYPEKTTLSGRLSAPDGTPLAGGRVILEWRPWAGAPAGGPFVPVENQPTDEGGKVLGVPTDADGFFSLAGVAPRWTTDYRARFVGAGADEAVTSPLEVVRLRVMVSLNVSGDELKLGRSRIISGAVSPAHEDMSVRLTIERNGVPVKTKSVPLRDSRYRFAYEPPNPGKYSVVASFPNHPPGHLGNKSPVKSFRVVR